MVEFFVVRLQYFLPKQLLTRLAGKIASAHLGTLTQSLIKGFIQRYQVNMAEAANPDPSSYTTFNDFFTRPLRNGARPLAQVDWICPVDGAISQFGQIQKDQIFQAKGHNYSTQALLGGNKSLATTFENGQFATLYLSPKDYHRIHMPCAGRLLSMTYVPGDLFSVNPATARGIPDLFARNERVITIFDSEKGQFALVLVGATIVGSMATIWHGVVNPPRTGVVQTWEYTDQKIVLAQGDEMGRFLLGSTVVMLFPQTAGLRFNPDWQAALPIKMGEKMAEVRHA